MLNVFSLVVMSHVVLQHVSSQTCSSSGFNGCECNILGACDIHSRPVARVDSKLLTGYAPMGVEQFRYKPNQYNLAYLCEHKTVTIMYDCNARIPLYAATMMTAAQLNSRLDPRIAISWGKSSDPLLGSYFQQTDLDYYKAMLERQLCYEIGPDPKYITEINWYRRKNDFAVPKYDCRANDRKTLKTTMSRGHMIARQYGRGDPVRLAATFINTNIVPQFETFNSNQWAKSENDLIVWGQNECATPYNIDARMFIVVGAIPSTYTDVSPRFFGKSGFSDFQGRSKLQATYSPGSGGEEYRVNVPSHMWTAACCTFKYKDAHGRLQHGTKSTAFFRTNDPGAEPCFTGTPKEMMNHDLWPKMTVPLVLFPQNANC